MRTRMSGGVGGGSRKALPYPDLSARPLRDLSGSILMRLHDDQLLWIDTIGNEQLRNVFFRDVFEHQCCLTLLKCGLD